MDAIKNKNISNSIFVIIIFSLSLLSACGGGGSSTPPPVQNISPTISVTDLSLPENTTGTVTATASDSDGSIASYAWVQKSGTNVILSNTNTDTVTLDAPLVTADTNIILTITVTDNDGATAAADVNVTISANILSFTVSGLVTVSPVADANVEFKIDDQSFTTTADANGLYSILIAIDDSYLDKIIEAIATGPEANSPLKLVSLLGSVEDIIQAAGADGILTKDELFDVNITNITTALAVLLEQANGNQSIIDKSVYLQAENELNADSLLPYAIAIKLILDFSVNQPTLALPNGFSDTYSFLKDQQQIGAYLNVVFSNFVTEYNQALNELLADNEIINPSIETAGIPLANDYYFTNPTKSIFPLKYSQLTLNDDGTGNLTEQNGSANFTYTINDNSILIAFPGIGYVEEEFSSGTIRQTISSSRALTWLHSSNDRDIVIIENITYTHFPNGESPDSSPRFSSSVVYAIKSEGVLNAVNVLQMETKYSMPVPQFSPIIQNPIGTPITPSAFIQDMMFSGDVTQGGTVVISTPEIFGDGSIVNLNAIHNWNIDSTGSLNIDGIPSFNYKFLANHLSKTPLASVIKNNGQVDISSSGRALLDEVGNLSTSEIVGIYVSPRSLAQQTPLSYFWIELNADNTSMRVQANDSNNDGQIGIGEFSIWPGRWEADSSDNITTRRYLIEGTGSQRCIPNTFEPMQNDTCVLFGEREWNIHQRESNGSIFVKQSFRIFDDTSRQFYPSPIPQGHILLLASNQNRYYQKVTERPVVIPPEELPLNKSTYLTSKISNKLSSDIIQKILKAEN